MSNPHFSKFVVLAIVFLATACTEQAETPEPLAHIESATDGEAPDAVTAAPHVYSTLHEDGRVRVVDMKLAPGQTDALHRHPHEVVYFLKGGHLHVELPTGETLDAELADGAVLSHDPWTHTVTNVGATDVHAIIVELRQEPGSRPPVAAERDAVSVAPDYYAVLHEDGRARVLEMRLPAGHTDGEHTHPDELVYFVAGGNLRLTTASGPAEVEIPDGHVLSHESWTHSVENIGEGDVHAVIWELK